MYPKGALMLNTIRHIVNDDAKWWKMILKYSETYRHQIIDTETVVKFFNKESGINLTPVFNQYLKYTSIPKLEFRGRNSNIEFRWKTEEPNFAMPIDITIKNKKIRLQGTNDWKKPTEKVKSVEDIKVLTNKFYIKY